MFHKCLCLFCALEYFSDSYKLSKKILQEEREMHSLFFQSVQRVKSAKNSSRQVVGKRFFIQNKAYPKRHEPAVNMLKIEGANCTPGGPQAGPSPSPAPSPRPPGAALQYNPQLGNPSMPGLAGMSGNGAGSPGLAAMSGNGAGLRGLGVTRGGLQSLLIKNGGGS